jgi:cyclopropane-fatty-acyl-phospholipid synthase
MTAQEGVACTLSLLDRPPESRRSRTDVAMTNSPNRRRIETLLKPANVRLGGERPWDIQVRDERFYSRVLTAGSLGVGESYMEGWWDCQALDELFTRILRARLDEMIHGWRLLLPSLRARLFNLQKPSRGFEIGRCHYDIGNELYRRMLDRRMIYSCGYWRNAATLEQAQEAKLDLCCRKLGLEKGMRLLDIGCGWGGTLQFAAEHYGVRGVGITVSEEQVDLARRTCHRLPVEIRLQDYRELDERFDRVLSVGMFEHVGVKNYRTFMQVVERCLVESGRFLLQTIGRNRSGTRNDAWIERYIFPNSMLPSAKQITAAAEGVFLLEDWHSFGPDYDRTLMAWFANFETAWDELKERYDERFYRMWKFYLLASAGGFRAHSNQLWQVLFSRRGVEGESRAR